MSKIFATVTMGGLATMRFLADEAAVRETISNYQQEMLERLKTRSYYGGRSQTISVKERRAMDEARILMDLIIVEFDSELLTELSFPIGSYLRLSRTAKGSYQLASPSSYNIVPGRICSANELHTFTEELKNFKDVTSQFIVVEETKIPTDVRIQAIVAKKNLASTGKVVTIIDDRINKPEDVEQFMTGLNKISVNIPGWGKVSMSPKSLGEVEAKQQYRTTYLAKIVE